MVKNKLYSQHFRKAWMKKGQILCVGEDDGDDEEIQKSSEMKLEVPVKALKLDFKCGPHVSWYCVFGLNFPPNAFSNKSVKTR